jgi:hypothetical protein
VNLCSLKNENRINGAEYIGQHAIKIINEKPRCATSTRKVSIQACKCNGINIGFQILRCFGQQ